MWTKTVCGWSLMASVASKLVGLNRRVMEIRHPPNLLYTLPPPTHSEDWYITWHTAAIINDSPVKRFHKNIFRYLSICYFPFSHRVLKQIRKIMPVLRKMDILNFILDLNFEIVRDYLWACGWISVCMPDAANWKWDIRGLVLFA